MLFLRSFNSNNPDFKIELQFVKEIMNISLKSLSILIAKVKMVRLSFSTTYLFSTNEIARFAILEKVSTNVRVIFLLLGYTCNLNLTAYLGGRLNLF